MTLRFQYAQRARGTAGALPRAAGPGSRSSTT